MITDQSALDRRSSPSQTWPDMEALRASVTELEGRARTRIVQRPVVAVMVAAGVGYLLARLASRGGR
jgi:hypothetical protein